MKVQSSARGVVTSTSTALDLLTIATPTASAARTDARKVLNTPQITGTRIYEVHGVLLTGVPDSPRASITAADGGC